MSVTKQVIFGILIAIGAALAIIFGVLPTVVEKKIEDTILAGTVLTPAGEGLTTAQYNDWVTTTVDIDYYFWNVTNLKALMTQGTATGLSMKTLPFTVKPILRQVGPISYQKRKTKYAINFNDDGTLVSYYDFTQWFRKTDGVSLNGEAFQPYDSIITTLNLPYLVTMSSTAFLGNDGTETNAHFGLFTLAFLQKTVGKIFYNDVPSNPNNLMPALRIMTYPLFIGYVNAVINSGNDNTIAYYLLQQFANPLNLNPAANPAAKDTDCIGGAAACVPVGGIQTTCRTAYYNLSTTGFVSRCVIEGAEFGTGFGRPNVEGLWELPANINVTHATWLLTDTTHPYGFQNKANHWLNFLIDLSTGGHTYLAECASYFNLNTCTVVAQWYGTVISTLPNPLYDQRLDYLHSIVLSLQGLVSGNPYNIPDTADVNSWSDLGYFQFGTCGLVKTLFNGAISSIVELGLPAFAALNGINLEPCAQKYRSLYAVQAGYPKWTMTNLQANLFLNTTIVSTTSFLTNLLACQTSPLSQDCALRLDYYFYIAKYGVFLPQIVGTTWDTATGAANYNDYGTGACWKPASSLPYIPPGTTTSAFTSTFTCPTDRIFGGSGLFTTRTAEELLLGVNNEALLLTVTGGLFGGIFGPNTTSSQSDALLSASPPLPSLAEAAGPYSVYTGKDGNQSRITFYDQYLGSASISTVADIYDGGDGTTGNPGSAPRICSVPGTVRSSFDAGCYIWQETSTFAQTEQIRGTSDGFKAPYMFQEGKTADDMIVWVDEGQRQVRFKAITNYEHDFKGIKVWRYKMEANTLMNTTTSDNKPKSRHYYMINHPNGVASRQRTDAIDLFVSKPHYLDGDVDFFKSQMDIDINPNVDIHDTYLDVEPLTGRVFGGRKRLQLGVYLSAVRQISFAFHGIYSPIVDNYLGNNATVESTCANLDPVNTPDLCTYPAWGSGGKNLYWPILWAAEGKDIADDDASSFTTAVYGNRKTFFITQIVLVIIGGIMFFTFLVLCIKARNESTSSL